MPWSHALSVDVSSLDAEHEAIVRGLENLCSDLDARIAPQQFIAGLDDLIEQVGRHFTHEERVMRNIRLPDFDSHRSVHESLMNELRSFRAGVARDGGQRSASEIKTYLRYWLFHHIHQDDMKIREHLHR